MARKPTHEELEKKIQELEREAAEYKHADKKLQESEKKYRQIYENIQDVYYEASIDGIILEISPSIENISQYTRQELLGKSLYDIYTNPEERDAFVKILLEKEKISDFEITLTDKGGSQYACSIVSVLVKDDEGNPVRIIGSMRDISERKRAEEALQESESKFRTLFNLIPQAIALAEVDTGVLIDVNRKYCELTKYSKEEIIGRTATELGLFSEEDRNKFLRELQMSGDVQSLEMDFKVKDGTILNALIFSRIIQLLNKTFTLNICIDVTEQKHAEEELKKSEDFNRTLFKYNPIQTIAVDLKGRIVDYNIAKEKSGDRLPDIGNVMYKDYAGRHKENMYAAMMDSIKRGEIKEFPALKYNDKFLSVTIAPYPYGAIITSQNITERIVLEEKLAHAEKMEAIGTLAGGIAHDYNNLLSVILGNIDLIELSAQPGSEMDSSLSYAKEACMRAKDLAHKLITFSKGGAPVKRAASIIELLKESSDFALTGSNVNCEFYISDNLWPVEYDENQMKHVINNLITNADQGMPDGGTIKVSAENFLIASKDKDPILQLQEGKYLKISIQDHGIGISPEHLSRIFDPYFSTKERGTQKGMGLGLATVYSIIDKHNGQITAESEEGTGSTFHIYLPAVEAEGMELRAKGGYGAQQSTIPPGRRPLRAGGINQQSAIRRVLVMDDEEMFRNLADQMLKAGI